MGLNRPFLLYVSRLEHRGKNHVRLIQAFSRFQSSKLHPTGAWLWQAAIGAAAAAIYSARHASGARDDIRFSVSSRSRYSKLYRAADAAVLPRLCLKVRVSPVEAIGLRLSGSEFQARRTGRGGCRRRRHVGS